jgi:hypothetical protein
MVAIVEDLYNIQKLPIRSSTANSKNWGSSLLLGPYRCRGPVLGRRRTLAQP